MENLNQELENLGSEKLKKLKPQVLQGAAPEGYFEQLNAQVFEKLRAEGAVTQTQERPTLTATRGGKWRQMAAAAAIVVLGAVTWFWLKPEPQSAMAAQVEISPEDAEAYLLATIDQVETDEFALEADALPNPLQESILKKPEPKAAQNTTEPTDIELNLLDELTDEDLEDLL
jgi:hypothetical protein